MIELYYWPTPNGHKISIALEELEVRYETHPVNILKGEQLEPGFLAINPNHRIPAIIDRDGPDGAPFTLFESGAILNYLAEKTGRLCPTEPRARHLVNQWLMFQVANVGPMFGQCGHFKGYAPETVPYAIERYTNETLRLYGVLDRHLDGTEYLAGDYSIADLATWPWVRVRWFHEIDLSAFPNVERWYEVIAARPGVQRGIALLADEEKIGDPSEETRESFFGKR